MQVRIGPLPSTGVTIWIAYARTVLAQVSTREASAPDPGAIAAFEAFLDEWEEVAERSDEFLWVAEVDPELASYLVHVYAGIVAELAGAAEERGFPLSPPEGEPFYQAVVAGLLDALAREEAIRPGFAEELRTSWPGLGPGR